MRARQWAGTPSASAGSVTLRAMLVPERPGRSVHCPFTTAEDPSRMPRTGLASDSSAIHPRPKGERASSDSRNVSGSSEAPRRAIVKPDGRVWKGWTVTP
jgi:hypothetical protein